MDNIARALSLLSHIVFLKKVLILLRVEKDLSASADVKGIVMTTFISVTHSEYVSLKLVSLITSKRAWMLEQFLNSVRL